MLRNHCVLHPHLSAWLLSSEYFSLWFAGIVCTGLWVFFAAFHVHRDQAIQDQCLARLHVGVCAATEEKSHCWDTSDPGAFRDFLLSSSSAWATLSLPLVTSLNLSQGIVASKVGLGRTVSTPLGIRGDKCHQKRLLHGKENTNTSKGCPRGHSCTLGSGFPDCPAHPTWTPSTEKTFPAADGIVCHPLQGIRCVCC